MPHHRRTHALGTLLLTALVMIGATLPAAATALAKGTGPAAGGTPTNTTAPGPAAAPPGFVALSAVDPSILQEFRYATAHNFTGRPINGYVDPTCVLTRPAAGALHAVQRALLRTGRSLKVYDCYRPQRAVDTFVEWARDLDDRAMKGEFYPDEDKANLFTDGYIAARSGHSRGSTVDLTVVDLPAHPTRPYVPGEPLAPCYAQRRHRFPDNSLDMGTGFDCFDTLANTLDPRITGSARKHRLLLKKAMEAGGFTNLPVEWWHYTLNDEPYPATYFDFPVAGRRAAEDHGDRRPTPLRTARGPRPEGVPGYNPPAPLVHL